MVLVFNAPNFIDENMNIFLSFLFISFIKSIYRNSKSFSSQNSNTKNRHLLADSPNHFTGKQTSHLDIPYLYLDVKVTQCIFEDCFTQNSHGGAINFASTSESRPNFELTSSTFRNCGTRYYGSRGGAVYVKGFQVTSSRNCFMNCFGSIGTYCAFDLADGSQFLAETSTFHSTTIPGLCEGSLFVHSDYTTVRDNNITQTHIGGDGAGFYLETSVSLTFLRNHLNQTSGSSIVHFNLIPDTVLFQYSNFLNNHERGNGVISILGNHAIDNCIFMNNRQLLVNLHSGTILLFRCTFDKEIENERSSCFHGLISFQEVKYTKETKAYAILHFNTLHCPCNPNNAVLHHYTPTKTPVAMGYRYNIADILSYIAFIVIFISLVFLLFSFLWLCFWSKPQLIQSMKYLRVRRVNTYDKAPVIENQSDSVTDDESDSHALFDGNDKSEVQFQPGSIYNNEFMTMRANDMYNTENIYKQRNSDLSDDNRKEMKKKKMGKDNQEKKEKSDSSDENKQYHFPGD